MTIRREGRGSKGEGDGERREEEEDEEEMQEQIQGLRVQRPSSLSAQLKRQERTRERKMTREGEREKICDVSLDGCRAESSLSFKSISFLLQQQILPISFPISLSLYVRSFKRNM
jgi:hypothetical protein